MRSAAPVASVISLPIYQPDLHKMEVSIEKEVRPSLCFFTSNALPMMRGQVGKSRHEILVSLSLTPSLIYHCNQIATREEDPQLSMLDLSQFVISQTEKRL